MANSLTSFIPKLWSSRLLYHLDNTHVFANLVNRDYEGEIKNYGDTVHINKIGNIQVKPYSNSHNLGATINGPDEIKMSDITLVIDQAHYFNFGIEDVDKAQILTPVMDKAMQRVAYSLADTTDRYLAAQMKAAIGEKHLGTSASSGLEITAANAYEQIVKLKIMMDQANVPTAGRYLVVPPAFEGIMLLDTRFASAYSSKAENALTNGLVARAAGFDIYVSNNCPETSKTYTCIASIADSTTYAEQIVKTEAYRPENKFADAVKGLNVYGVKVTEPEMVFGLYAKFSGLSLPSPSPEVASVEAKAKKK